MATRWQFMFRFLTKLWRKPDSSCHRILNILSPAHGEPLAAPTQDLVIGPYFLTADIEGDFKGDGTIFYSAHEVEMALRIRKWTCMPIFGMYHF